MTIQYLVLADRFAEKKLKSIQDKLGLKLRLLPSSVLDDAQTVPLGKELMGLPLSVWISTQMLSVGELSLSR